MNYIKTPSKAKMPYLCYSNLYFMGAINNFPVKVMFSSMKGRDIWNYSPGQKLGSIEEAITVAEYMLYDFLIAS